MVTGGLSREEAIRFAKMIEDKVDCIHVSAGMMAEPSTIPYFHPPNYLPHGPNVHLAEKIKQEVNIPVTCVGAITDPEMAEDIIANGRADLVAMARALIADPELPIKTLKGKTTDIIPCTRCLECLGRVAAFLPVRCASNPVSGRETECSAIPDSKHNKKVVIAGGGPAGMQAAITAVSRGHNVILYEKTDSLGGSLTAAAIPPFKGDTKRFLYYLFDRIDSLPVEVRLSTEATPENIRAENPDVLIIAVGAKAVIPDIPGIDKPFVSSATDILEGRTIPGNSIVVAGGGLVGCETALFLAQQGKKVVIVEMLDDIASDLNPVSRILLLELLEKEGVEIRTNEKLVEIEKDGIKVADRASRIRMVAADTVVLSLGFQVEHDTVNTLGKSVPETRVIGDCGCPGKIMDAIHGGFNIAVEI